MTPEDSIGQRIRSAREAKGMTQQQLADKSGVPRSALGHIEQGRRDPTVYTVLRLAEGLGVDAGELVRGLRAG